MQGAIQVDHIPKNNYELLVSGYQTMVITTISEIETELETATMPDRTEVSGGNTKASEFTIELPSHHTVDQAAMEQWFSDSQDPVALTYKKIGTLVMKSISGQYLKSFALTGLFPKKRALSEKKMDDEGELDIITWTMSADSVEPLGA